MFVALLIFQALLTVEKVERNSRRMREDGSNEIERVREQMLERMKDLQPLPELLKVFFAVEWLKKIIAILELYSSQFE